MNLEWPGASRVQQRAFRRLFVRLSRPVPQGAEIVTAYTDGQVTLRSNRGKERYHEAADLSTYQGVEAGDFVVHGLDIMRGSIGVSDSRGAMSPVCIVCRPTQLAEPRYMAYAMRLQAASDYPKALARGVRDGGADFRRWDTLADLPLPSPPVEDQRGIADFLDRETAKIDALIEKQNELIVLLRARRKAMVRALLAPVEGGKTQDRGWTFQPLKRALISLDGVRIPLSSEERGNRKGEFPYYGASGVIDHVDDYLFDEELVLVSEDGANLLLRSTPIAFTASGRYWVNNHAHVLRPRFGPPLFWAARIEMEDISTFVTGSAQPKLTAEALMNLRISWPIDLEKMIEVASQLASETAHVDTLIAKTEEFIALAKERRAALITAAVTGQIDVSGEAS